MLFTNDRVRNKYLAINKHGRPLSRAGPGTFVLTQKYPKSQVTRKASLPHLSAHYPPLAFALQTGQNHGLLNFALLRSLLAPRFCKK
jgi:hypothetical protein